MRVIARAIVVFFVCASGLLSGQTSEFVGAASSTSAKSSKDASIPKSSDTTIVKPDDAVITVRGLCSSVSSAPADSISCTKVVTRKEFDSLLNAANVSGQQVSPVARQNFAKGYVLYLAFEQAAKQAGFEDTEQFEEIMKWARLRAITEAYRGKIVEDARTSGQTEVDAYYREHLDLYDRLSVLAVTIPKSKPGTRGDKDFDREAKEVSETTQRRLIDGGDPNQVQRETYSTLGLAGAPVVDVQRKKRSDYPQEEADELFSLKAGAVSKIETEGDSYVVYKIVSHDELPEAKVQDQIVRAIAEEKVKGALSSISNSVQPEFNPAYFGREKQPPLPH
jgi:hypothetical protein